MASHYLASGKPGCALQATLQQLCSLHYLLFRPAHMRSDLLSHFIERQLENAVALAGAKLVYLALQQVGAEPSTELWALVLCAWRIPSPRPTWPHMAPPPCRHVRPQLPHPPAAR